MEKLVDVSRLALRKAPKQLLLQAKCSSVVCFFLAMCLFSLIQETEGMAGANQKRCSKLWCNCYSNPFTHQQVKNQPMGSFLCFMRWQCLIAYGMAQGTPFDPMYTWPDTLRASDYADNAL